MFTINNISTEINKNSQIGFMRLSQIVEPQLYLYLIDKELWEIIKDLADNIFVEPSESGIVVSINGIGYEITQEDEIDLSIIVENLLHRSGYLTKHNIEKERAVKIANILAIPLSTALKKLVSDIQPIITTKIKSVTVREELAGKIAKQLMAEYIIKTFYVESGNEQSVIDIFCFNGIVYTPCEVDLKRRIQEIANRKEEIFNKITGWVINEALRKVRDSTLEPLHYEPSIIAFKNTLFDWDKFLQGSSIITSSLMPNPNIVVFHQIPHRLVVDGSDQVTGLDKYSEVPTTTLEKIAESLCPKSLKAFKDWVGDKWILLFEIIGYTLYPKYDLHKAIMLIGEGSNGKSTYLKLIKTILGSGNVSSISLQELSDPEQRFVAEKLYHKLANIYADLPEKPMKETGKFKILTGEDSITADRKFKDPITFTNYAKLLFSANELPSVSDMTVAFWRRWLVIEFPNQFPEDPAFFEKTFTEEEIEGIIFVSLLAFRNAWLKRKFSFEESEADYKEMWLRNTNSVYAFISDLLNSKIEGYRAEKDPEGKVDSSELYEIYTKYCELEEREAVAKRIFTLEMERLGYKTVRTAKARYYKGLKLIQA
ncbi:MAG: DNA primase family protein [Infirmifilum sp.]